MLWQIEGAVQLDELQRELTIKLDPKKRQEVRGDVIICQRTRSNY